MYRALAATIFETAMFQPAVNSFTLPPDVDAATRRVDALAIIVLVAIGAIAAITFCDYGLGWDDYIQSQYGDLLVLLYSSGFADKRALAFDNLYLYGGGFDLLSALAAKVLPFGLFETRRLLGATVGLIGLFVTWRLGRRLGGPIAGLIALLLLAACPLYYGHMFINAKDAPFAVTMAIALLGIVRAFEEYPHPTPAVVALCGIGVGLATGSRIMGAFAVLSALLSLVMVLAIRSRESGLKIAFGECGKSLAAFIPGVVLAYLVMGLVWPWAVLSPLNPFRAVSYFSNTFLFVNPWRQLFDGQLILVTDMPRSYVPTLFALTVPGLTLALGLAGTVGAIIALGGDRDNMLGRRAALFATVLTAMLPILITIVARPPMYDGIRHFVFTLPPFAVLGGVSGAWIVRWLERQGRTAIVAGSLILCSGIAFPIIDMVRMHPYEYAYFNRIAGGVAGARPRYMLDYWGLSLTQASRELRRLVADRHETPRHGTWKVAVCGPDTSVKVALGTQFTITRDPRGADFAMLLGELSCAKLDAPVILEIEREGVIYTRVYDIRDRSVSTPLTVP
jgi:hypothetical protein